MLHGRSTEYIRMKKWHEAAKKKNWQSLTQLKNHIEKNKLEKVISFDGAQLITDKATYGLYAGEISIWYNDKRKNRKVKEPAVKSKNHKKIKAAVKKVTAKRKKRKMSEDKSLNAELGLSRIGRDNV